MYNRKLFTVLVILGAMLLTSTYFLQLNVVLAQQTGGIDVDGYCKRHHGQTAYATLAEHNAYGWVCALDGVNHGVNMALACIEQYGQGASVHYRDFGDPYSWYCIIPESPSIPPTVVVPPTTQAPPTVPAPISTVNEARGMDFNGYCVSQGHSKVMRTRDDAYSWACDHNGAQDWRQIDTRQLCIWQHGSNFQHVRLGHIDDSGSWSCNSQPQATPVAGYITYYGAPPPGANVNPDSVPPCPSGVGTPGSFPPETLTQQQRNELYLAFGHSGTAPVGYGGEACSGGTMTLPSFTGGSTGNSGGSSNQPDPSGGSSGGASNLPTYGGLASLDGQPAGQYVRVTVTSLRARSTPSTSGEILGYLTNGHYYRLLDTSGDWGRIEPLNREGRTTSAWAFLTGYSQSIAVASSEPNQEPEPLIAVQFPYSPLNLSFTFQVELKGTTCWITNGSEFVAMELSRYRASLAGLPVAQQYAVAASYLADKVGSVEHLRRAIEHAINGSVACESVYYEVGNHTMDTSGLGNIAFGFTDILLGIPGDDLIANIAQIGSSGHFGDNPDDISQRNTGEALAVSVGMTLPISRAMVELHADTNGLY